MDEPFSALDLISIQMLKEIIINLQTENRISIVIADHQARDLLTCVDTAIILRKNPYKLMEIYEKRKYDEEKVKENLGSEILGIIAHDTISEFGNEKTFQVDTTEKTPAIIVEKIQNLIQERKNSDEVDWLSEIKQNGDLQTFFDY